MLQQVRDLIQNRINLYRYRKLTAGIEKPEFQLQRLKDEGYYSQSGQDKWLIEKLLPGKKNGIFVDIGANDGITFSNTFLLEKMGWNGLAVEPIPSVYKKLIDNRTCIAVNGCVAPTSGKKQFRVLSGYPQMLSGLVEEYDPRHIGRIKRELDSHGGNSTDIEIDCYNFNELLERHGFYQIDYLSIDVEGVEYKILNSIDFDRIHISIISVENNYSDLRIPELLTNNGFVLHSIVGDEFYRNSKTA